MKRQARVVARRIGDAYRTLRGRPPKPDYGVLVVMPFLAAAGGSLVAYGAETLLEIRRARYGRTEGTPARGRRPAERAPSQTGSASSTP